SSYFNTTPWRLRDARSNSYHAVDGKLIPNGPEFDTGITTANGGLNAPVGDMVRWLAFLMDSSPSAGNTVLAWKSRQEMWTPITNETDSALFEPAKMGLSFFLHQHEGRRLVGHTGNQMSFITFFLLDPETK